MFDIIFCGKLSQEQIILQGYKLGSAWLYVKCKQTYVMCDVINVNHVIHMCGHNTGTTGNPWPDYIICIQISPCTYNYMMKSQPTIYKYMHVCYS